jgi:predicted transcriptional regulator of viral defense system
MTRSISPSLARLLEKLELEQPDLVTSDDLARMVEEAGLRTPAKVVASRLRERGWLLATDRRGVWEFAPGSAAGPYSRHDPVTPLRAFLSQRPAAKCGLTFQAAAWAHGIADRAPARLEVAAADRELTRQLPETVAASVFAPHLDYVQRRGVPTLQLESVLVHMSSRPMSVRSWESAREWLPELTAELRGELMERELDDRPATTSARTGYLLQGLRPDLAEQIFAASPPRSKTWFGSRGPLRRHDNRWLVADTTLPFDPRQLPATA